MSFEDQRHLRSEAVPHDGGTLARQRHVVSGPWNLEHRIESLCKTDLKVKGGDSGAGLLPCDDSAALNAMLSRMYCPANGFFRPRSTTCWRGVIKLPLGKAHASMHAGLQRHSRYG